jgi:hypothetical protein
MARRTKIGKSYVIRRKNGQFMRFSKIRRSIRSDKQRRAVAKVKSGYRYKGD